MLFISVIVTVYVSCLVYVEVNEPIMNAQIIFAAPLAYFLFATITCLVITYWLVKENKKINQLFKSQVIKLNEQKEDLEMFAKLASHDLKSPLRSVMNYVDLIEQKVEKNKLESISDNVEMLKFSADQMAGLIEAIKNFSLISEEKKLTNVCLDTVLQNVCEILQVEFSSKHAEIESDSLPFYNCVESEMFLIFQNLIKNGLTYNQSIHPRIEIKFYHKPTYYHIIFKDNGIGIDEKFQHQIFQSFSRLHNNAEYKGTGLGLTLALKLVESYGGEIILRSEVGKGSEFELKLPR